MSQLAGFLNQLARARPCSSDMELNFEGEDVFDIVNQFNCPSSKDQT